MANSSSGFAHLLETGEIIFSNPRSVKRHVAGAEYRELS